MNADERRKLKNQVTDMVRIGYSYTDIGHKLGISKRSIVSYMKKEREDNRSQMIATAEDQVVDFQGDKWKRIQKLWTIALDDTKKAGEITKAIALLQSEETLEIKRKQLIGLLPQEAPLVAIQNNQNISLTIADTVKKVFPELINTFSKNKAKVLNERNEDNK